MRRLAAEAMTGKASDPWQHLIQARGYRLIGESERAETELAAASSAAPDDLDVLVATARLLDKWDDPERSGAVWQRVVDLGGDDDPMPWIHRGHWYAQRGEQEKADADFAKAASLTPNELNKFLEAGWWVAGPYPGNLAEFCPPELDPNPAKPVHTIDPKTGLSGEPSHWVNVPTGRYGVVNLSGAAGHRNGGSVYAMAQVYSPDERTVLLMTNWDHALRVWVNGELIVDFSVGDPKHPHYEHALRSAVVLRSGRNTILVKTAALTFTLRVGDSPRDRIVLLAEQQRLTEAADLFSELNVPISDYQSQFFPWHLIKVLATHNDHVGFYERISAEFAQLEPSDRYWKLFVSDLCAQRPNPSFDAHAERMVSYAEEFAATRPEFWALFNAALVNYRAGRYQRAKTMLEQSKWMPHSLPVQALLEHQAGDESSATRSLEAALAAGIQYHAKLGTSDRSDLQQAGPFYWWYEWAQFLTLLREAEQTIRGKTTASDQLKLAVEETMVEKWAQSPDLVPYDQVMLFTAYNERLQLDLLSPLIARGKRLAELGRLDEAEADFNKAVSLAASDDYLPLVERAEYRIDIGNVAGATRDFDAALAIANAVSYVPHGSFVEGMMRRHQAVLDERRQDLGTWRFRAETAVLKGDWDRAADCLSSDDGYWSQCVSLAAIRTIQQDHAGHAAACTRLAEIIDQHFPEPRDQALWQALALGVSPDTSEGTEDLIQLAQAAHSGVSATPIQQFTLGLAHYRAGDYEEALPLLNAAIVRNQLSVGEARNFAVLAMAHFRLGNMDEARRSLKTCRIWLDLFQQRREKADAGHPALLCGQGGPGWVVSYALIRESMLLIDGRNNGQWPTPTIRRP